MFRQTEDVHMLFVFSPIMFCPSYCICYRNLLINQKYCVVFLGFQCKKNGQKVKPYLKNYLPKRFHYANSRRIEDVSVIVKPGWLFERYRFKKLHPTSST